jgi:sterol desaturase/sphingolipid hydroxylase (fatty acid hydroxylase superfamily)
VKNRWADAALLEFERMAKTKANHRAAQLANLGMTVVLVALGIKYQDLSPIRLAAAFLLGMLLFSLIEYCFHRWLFHGPEHAMERGHQRHHLEPAGIDSLPFFLPPMFLFLIAGSLAEATSPGFALVLTGGIACGYFAYSECHDSIHRGPYQNSLARRWAAHHHIHHYHPDRNFGVTSPLWDIFFRTRYRRPRQPPRIFRAAR